MSRGPHFLEISELCFDFLAGTFDLMNICELNALNQIIWHTFVFNAYLGIHYVLNCKEIRELEVCERGKRRSHNLTNIKV